jgi:hypothetical protein
MSKYTLLPDGSAFGVFTFDKKIIIQRWVHKLFKCPTFWKINASFSCPGCGKKYRCYWDGNDVDGHGIDYCDKCADKLET